MNSTTGYIKIFRSSLQNPLYQLDINEPFDKWHAWEDLLLNANYRTTKKLYRGQMQVTYPGQLRISIEYLAERWHWSRGKVIRFLKLLENEGMITKRGYADGTALTIENWGKYQVERYADGTTDGTPDGISDGTTDGTRNKNIKNIKNNNNPLNPPQGGAGGDDDSDLVDILRRIGRGEEVD